MFPKDSWEKDDTLIIQNVHGKIVEFNTPGNRVKLEHRDNENQPYLRWYDVKDLPPYPAGEPFLPPEPQSTPPTPTLPHSDGEGSEKKVSEVAVVADDLPDDVEALKQIIRGHRVQLGNQASSLNAMMKDADDDYTKLKDERDELKRINEQQSELLKQAAIASVKPSGPIETRLQAIEKQLADIGDWVEGAVQQSMDEAEMATTARVLELNKSVPDYTPLFLVMARAFAMAAGEDLKAAVGHEAQKAS